MLISGKLVIAVVVALIATFAATALGAAGIATAVLGGLFLASNVAAVLLTHRPLAALPASKQAPSTTPQPKAPPPRSPAQRSGRKPGHPSPARVEPGAARTQGTVKWFNGTKGFGFITLDNGDEIFVHFRSIRGEGRRSLEDGQRVSFVVASTEKGPQAEDVEPLPAG
jgi:cold shock CspA family protein